MDLTTLGGVQALLDTTPIHRWLDFRVVELDAAAGIVSLTAPVCGNSERMDGGGQAHGGAIAALIDSAATFACSVSVGHTVPTMNLRVDYLRPATGDLMTATATVRRAGRTVAVVDVDVQANGKLVAVGRCGQATGS